MDKKDKQLNTLFDNLEKAETPREELLTPAMQVLRAQNAAAAEKAAKKAKYNRKMAFSIVMSFVVVVGIILSAIYGLPHLFGGGSGGDTTRQTVYYDITDLKASQITSENKNLFPELGTAVTDNVYVQYSYKNETDPVLVGLKTRVVSDDGALQYITVFAEVQNDKVCSEFKTYKNMSPVSGHDGTANSNTIFENGEFITRIYIVTNDVKYYITIMSNIAADTEDFVLKFL